MRLLLDTPILLWWLDDAPALPAAARAAISDVTSEIFVSVATIWEIAIKRALGKLDFPIARLSEILVEAGCLPLPVCLDHAIAAGGLPLHHGDPFDRMLVAQAQREGLTIVTVDRMIRLYPVSILGDTNN
jgi:PIN domain nuclease of toxin-antitoxin system